MSEQRCFYHESVGPWVTMTIPSADIVSSYPAGTIEIPLPPSPLHKCVDGQWIAPTQEEIDEAEAEKVRTERNFKLRFEVDVIVMNPLRWLDMTAEEQQIWSDYRRALLDVPQQEGFPYNVTWPTKPT